MIKNITNISTVIGLFLSFHYFFSYRWLSKWLEFQRLRNYDIISLEDLTFPFGSINLKIFSLSIVGLFFIAFWHLLFTIETENEFRNEISSKIKKVYSKLSKKLNIKMVWTEVLFGILPISILLGIMVFSSFDYSEDNKLFMWSYTVLTIFVPTVYILIPEKRPIFLPLFFGVAFVWMNVFINKVYSDLSTKSEPTIRQQDSYIKYNIEYSNKEFSSVKGDQLIYAGYRYWVFRNDSIGSVNLIPTKEIKIVNSKTIKTNHNLDSGQ